MLSSRWSWVCDGSPSTSTLPVWLKVHKSFPTLDTGGSSALRLWPSSHTPNGPHSPTASGLPGNAGRSIPRNWFHLSWSPSGQGAPRSQISGLLTRCECFCSVPKHPPKTSSPLPQSVWSRKRWVSLGGSLGLDAIQNYFYSCASKRHRTAHFQLNVFRFQPRLYFLHFHLQTISRLTLLCTNRSRTAFRQSNLCFPSAVLHPLMWWWGKDQCNAVCSMAEQKSMTNKQAQIRASQSVRTHLQQRAFSRRSSPWWWSLKIIVCRSCDTRWRMQFCVSLLWYCWTLPDFNSRLLNQ